jgi:quinoprotein glucose dehydrogenase
MLGLPHFKRSIDAPAIGAALWDVDAPARPRASPMTYLHQGKQYIVVAAGSGTSAELIAFALGQ